MLLLPRIKFLRPMHPIGRMESGAKHLLLCYPIPLLDGFDIVLNRNAFSCLMLSCSHKINITHAELTANIIVFVNTFPTFVSK